MPVGSDYNAEKAEALRSLSLDIGTIQSVERATSPSMVNREGRVIENLPPRTVIRWTLTPVLGSKIQAEMWLPDADCWNERFLGVGNGGAAGFIRPEGFVDPIAGNFAVAVTDMGTAPNADSGIGNREVWKDFGYRATHLMTVTAKQIAEVYYGRAPRFSYFVGASTGGQQGMQEAQRYPEDYDGIISYVPGHCRTSLHAYFLWNDLIISECQFTEAQEANIIAAGNEYMASRESPAVAGKFISDPRSSAADITAVIDLAQRKAPFLTCAQAEGLRKLFEGPTHPVTGERIFGGIPFGTTLREARGHLYLFKWVFGQDRDLRKINFADDIDTYTSSLGPYLNAENADLRPFQKRGGKLLIIPGSADSVVPYYASIDYYERLISFCGGLEQARRFARLFIIPGMGHGIGPGVNSLSDTLRLVMDWREKGIAPELLLGKRIVDEKLELELPIYPYPFQARWSPEAQAYEPAEGLRGNVPLIAPRYRPEALE